MRQTLDMETRKKFFDLLQRSPLPITPSLNPQIVRSRHVCIPN